jgi:hypothetical protein
MLPPMSTSASKNLGTVIALLVLSSAGCAYGELRQVLRAQIASEADCPDIVLTKFSPYAPGYKPDTYAAKGCNVDRIYTCKDEGMVKFGHAPCTYVDSGTSVKPPPLPAADDMGDEPMESGAAPAADEPAAEGL